MSGGYEAEVGRREAEAAEDVHGKKEKGKEQQRA